MARLFFLDYLGRASHLRLGRVAPLIVIHATRFREKISLFTEQSRGDQGIDILTIFLESQAVTISKTQIHIISFFSAELSTKVHLCTNFEYSVLSMP
jgi:hypothetical protein